MVRLAYTMVIIHYIPTDQTGTHLLGTITSPFGSVPGARALRN